MEKLKIFVCCHKNDPQIRKEPPFCPIQVGKSLHPDIDLGFINDNVGENISERNSQWCELTAIYWIWKNVRDVEYIGLNHYRRYFAKEITDENIDTLIKGYDIITVEKQVASSMQMTYRWLLQATSQEDYYLFIDSLLTIHPDAKEAVLEYFYNNNAGFTPFTMFITKKDLFDEYCGFIFPVLFEVEKRLRRHGYSRLNRAIAYFGEYSLGLFITYKHLRVKQLPYVLNGIKYKMPKVMRYRSFLAAKLAQLGKVSEITITPDILVGFKTDGIDLTYLGK